MRMYYRLFSFTMPCLAILVWLAAAPAPLKAADPVEGSVVSCDEFLVPPVEINGEKVGQEACRMIENEVTFQGKKVGRIDMGVSGTLDGYTTKQGRIFFYFSSHTEFMFPQRGNTHPIYHGIGRYSAASGSSMTVLYPLEPNAWNGKMWVTAHGAGRSFLGGNLKLWDRNFTPEEPFSDISKYEKLMLEKGYAVAKTRRSTVRNRGDIIVTLDDGTVLRDRNVSEQPPMIMQFAKLAENILRERLGREPSRTYWYGHSGGARPGRIVNYQPGLNVDQDGGPVIDGIVADDSGAGLWLPVVYKDGKDILFATEQDRERFVPQIDISHLLYTNETPDDHPDWVFNNFLANKRMNAKILRDKGLGHRHRVFEIGGISHSGGEYLPDGKQGDVEILDMSRIMDGLIDILDNWVENGVAPPPSKSDWAELGDLDGDGLVEHGPVALPEVACPLGVYHIFPPSRGTGGQGTTGFVPFSGEGLEPEDGRGNVSAGPTVVNVVHNFVDMNHNGYRDFRETVTQAWQRVGLLEPNEKFDRERYRACVRGAVNKLTGEGFITSNVADFYLGQSATMPLPER